jgi:PASTA domain-containing protein/HAAS domain-containing protein
MSDALLGSELDGMVNAYLLELHDALRRLPTSQRDHLVSDIREHIVERRAERPVRDRSGMEALLNRVGLPEDIAAVALEGEIEQDEPPVTAPVTSLPLSRRLSIPIVAAVAAGVLVLVLCVGLLATRWGPHQAVFPVVFRSSSAAPVSVKPPSLAPVRIVPNVIGENESEALASLSAAGLSAKLQGESSATVPAGQVIAQDPPSGLAVPRHSGVVLIVSSGPAPATS